jgi:hypothetical protein
MMLNGKSVASSNSVLQLLDQRFLEFLDASALDANEVIVVGIVVGKLVSSEPVAKTSLVRDAAVGEHFKRAINGRITDSRIGAPDALQELVDGHVLRGLEKSIDDDATLLGRTQALLDHVRLQLALEAFRVWPTWLPSGGSSARIFPARH